MADYIRREEALADFESCNAENPRWTPQRVKTLLLRQPAADVTEVVHGRWISLPSMAPEYACSVCGYYIPGIRFWNAPYCPKCGARMDGGEDRETNGGGDNKCL